MSASTCRVIRAYRGSEAAEKLRRRIARDREHLFVLITDRDVPATNNACETCATRERDLPQVDERVPFKGRPDLCRFPIRRQYCQGNNRSVLDDLRSVLATPSSNHVSAQPG